MIVVDASVMVPAFIEAPTSALARKAVAPQTDWILPPLWQFEFTSAMVTLVRGGEIDERTAHVAIAEARTAVTNREVPVDQGQVVRLALRLTISAYDAQYLTLAEEYGIVCVTADRELRQRANKRAVLLDEFVR